MVNTTGLLEVAVVPVILLLKQVVEAAVTALIMVVVVELLDHLMLVVVMDLTHKVSMGTLIPVAEVADQKELTLVTSHTMVVRVVLELLSFLILLKSHAIHRKTTRIRSI